MRLVLVHVLHLLAVLTVWAGAAGNSSSAVLSRQRRYIAFPRGSSIQLVFDFSIPGFIPFTTIHTMGVLVSMAWRLPYESADLYLMRRAAGEDPDLQHRLAFFEDMAVFLEKLGLPGEQCVRRTICEYRRRGSQRGNLMTEILDVLFKVSAEDLPDLPATENATCEDRYPQCSSILDLPVVPAYISDSKKLKKHL